MIAPALQFLDLSPGDPLGQAELSSRKTTEGACQEDETEREATAPLPAHGRPSRIGTGH
jgi:hypothetical protein